MTTDVAFFAVNSFLPRKNSGDGPWVLFLLPLSIIISAIKHPVVLTPMYKIMTCFAIGLTLNSFVILMKYRRSSKLYILDMWCIVCVIVTSVLFHIGLNRGWEFCLTGGIFASIVYIKLYKFLMSKLQNTFTLGEGGLVAQALTILLYGIILKIAEFDGNLKKSNVQISTTIIQFGLFGLLSIAYSSYAFQIKRPETFYSLFAFVIIFVILLPLHSFIEDGPLLWIFTQLFKDQTSIFLLLFWGFCVLCVSIVLNTQVSQAKKASTGRRKIFHFLLVVIFIPGFLYKCSLLYLATGVALGLLFFLDMLRILEMPPLARHLQDGFTVFKDEKDDGAIALTPIYLLSGCSLPLWIHPAPCDVTDTAMFCMLPLLSGLLSIGIGDAAASFVGSNFGRIHWPKSRKTIEGTLACVLSQIAFLYMLVYFDVIRAFSREDFVKSFVAICLASYVEAKTSQIDNLVLPFIMYIILV